MTHYSRDLYVSWEEFHRDTRTLCRLLLERQPHYRGVIAVTRGGLIPAGIVARELDLRLVETVCVASYRGAEAREQGVEVEVIKALEGSGEGMVLIDDLVDTGKTAKVIREMLPQACFATVYAKPAGRPTVDVCVREVTQNTWIRFPWDTALSFTPPLVDNKEDA